MLVAAVSCKWDMDTTFHIYTAVSSSALRRPHQRPPVVWRRVNVFVFSVLSCRASRFQLQFRKSSCITVKSASAGSASTFHRFVERLQPRFVHDITTTVCVCAAPREEGVVHILHLHIDTSRNDASTASASCLSVALSCS